MGESHPDFQNPILSSDPLLNPQPDPWEDTETAHLRAFLKLTYSERFHLLMDAIEFMHKLRPPRPEHCDSVPLTALNVSARRGNDC